MKWEDLGNLNREAAKAAEGRGGTRKGIRWKRNAEARRGVLDIGYSLLGGEERGL